jgi:DNA-binding transcriptional LysR family regulator
MSGPARTRTGAQMRARHALDHGLGNEGLTLVPRVESDSVEALFAVAATGAAVAVVPESSVDPGHLSPRLRAVPLVEPEVTLSIALALLGDEPRPSLSAAIWDVLDS